MHCFNHQSSNTAAKGALPYTVWILKNYFQTILHDLEDAARVDRCNWLQAMIRVILPVSLPGIVAVGIFSFMAS